MFCWQVYCNADVLAMAEAADEETFQIVSLMLTMAESEKNTWTYGSKLLYEMRVAGIVPARREVAILLAQDGSENQAKSQLLESEPLAVHFYNAKLLTLCNTLTERNLCYKRGQDAIKLPEREANPAATIKKLAMTYIPACIGQDQAERVKTFLAWLGGKRSDFYTKYSGTETTLAEHSLDVIDNLVRLTRPTTEAQLGECILAGLGHEIGEIGVYANGTAFDPMPFGYGRKSLYIMSGFFEKYLPERVANAIDAHMCDQSTNPYVLQQMMQEPLELYLHMADVMATYIDNK